MGVLSRGARGAVPVVGVVVASVVLGTAPAHAAPETVFQMPFPCAQEWTGTTRANHSPSTRAIDWNRPDDVGDPVVAAAPGVVTVAETRGSSGYGNWVSVTHPSGESTRYAHLESVAVIAGQSVDQGALLGAVGNSGNSSGPHLHFEERDEDGVVTPWFDGLAFAFGSTLASRNCVDVPVAGNFVGGPEAEVAVYRRAQRSTFLIQRPDRTPKVLALGTSTDQPVVGDWDGDGRANPGVRTPTTRTFQLRTPAGTTTLVFGAVADLPVAGDWDGDGLWEIGVRRAADGKFRLRAADGTTTVAYLGDADDLPVTGDWDGDGRTDIGVFDAATATYTLRIVDADGLAWTAQVVFGQPWDLPVVGDWDGNLKTDVGVWHPESAVFDKRHAPSAIAARTTSVSEVRFGRRR